MPPRLSNFCTQQRKSKLKIFLSPLGLTVGIAFLVTIFLVLLNQGISFQILEWVIYDQYFRLRLAEESDPRLVIVTVDEPDISQLQQWPLSDAKILQLFPRFTPRFRFLVGRQF